VTVVGRPIRHVSDAEPGTMMPDVSMPITLYKLVMAAGGNRDFNAIHHNRDYARSTGAPDAYANTLFLMGLWERAVEEWTGAGGRIVAIRGLRMVRFNTVGSTAVVSGAIKGVDDASRVVTFTVATSDADGITVGPGEVDVLLPDSR
jgi:acyl dehydratase